MNLKKKALATAVFMALSAAPAVLPVNYMATSVVCAAPASEIKAEDAFQVDFKMVCRKVLKLPTAGRTAICSM